MSLLAVKGLSILAIIVVGLIGGAIPMRAAGREASERFFSVGNAFVGEGRAKSSGISAYVLVVILSVHSIIAGLSVGFEPKMALLALWT